MSDWRREVTGRQWAALGLYGVAFGLMAGSMPLSFFDGGGGALSERPATWKMVWELANLIVKHPEAMSPDSWSDFVEGPLPAFALVLSHLMILPGILLLYLSSKNRWFCWAGRLVWPLIWISGPLVFLGVLTQAQMNFNTGFWVWCTWVLLVSVAQWVVAPRRLSPGDSLPGPERVLRS